MNIEPIKYTKNLFKNSSFEDTSNYEVTTKFARTGQYSHLIDGQSMLFKSIAPGIYSCSGYFKNDNPIDVNIRGGMVPNTLTLFSGTIPVNKEFTRYSTILPISSEISDVRFTFDTEGEAYLDDIQLEEGEVTNYYNMLLNGDFSDGFNGWNKDSWNTDNFTKYPNDITIVNLDNNKKAVKIVSDPSKSFILSKVVKTSGKKNTNSTDIYNLSFWYKNTGLVKDYDSDKGVLINFGYDMGDMGYDIPPVRLNGNSNEWQFFSEPFMVDNRYDYKNLILNFIGMNNTGELYITDISITKDIDEAYNVNDPNTGNLTSSRNSNGAKTDFKYNKNNQLTDMFNPKGNHFEFEYDNNVPDRILKGISPTGISNEIKYDSFGNPNKTIITNVNPNSEIEDNKYYYIRLKGTEKYLDCNFINRYITIKEDTCSHDAFKMIKDNNNYRIKIGNLYLGVVNNKVYLYRDIKYSTLFKLVLNDNSSYSFITNNKKLCIKNNNLVISDESTKEEEQQFYFEDTDTNLYIETKAEYTEDGKFLTKTIDTLGNYIEYDVNPVSGLTNKVTDSNNVSTLYTYNDKEQVTKVIRESKEVDYVYNDKDLLSSIKSGSKEYKFNYDDFLNTSSISINDNNLVNNIYEENNGNLIKTTYGNGSSINYTYDDIDRVKSIINDQDTFEYAAVAANVLKSYPSKETLKHLVEALRSKNWYVRNNAACAIVSFATEKELESLKNFDDKYGREALMYHISMKKDVVKCQK